MTDLPSPPALYSAFAGDPEFADLIEQFVAEIDERLACLQRAAAENDWAAIHHSAHQIKGAVGSYGFPEVTPVAGRLEEASRANANVEEILAAVEALINLCSRIQPGLPS